MSTMHCHESGSPQAALRASSDLFWLPSQKASLDSKGLDWNKVGQINLKEALWDFSNIKLLCIHFEQFNFIEFLELVAQLIS